MTDAEINSRLTDLEMHILSVEKKVQELTLYTALFMVAVVAGGIIIFVTH